MQHSKRSFYLFGTKYLYSSDASATISSEVGRRLAAVRRFRRLDRETIAATSGLALTRLNDIEAGACDISLDEFYVLLNSLQLSADWILPVGAESDPLELILATDRLTRLPPWATEFLARLIDTMEELNRALSSVLEQGETAQPTDQRQTLLAEP